MLFKEGNIFILHIVDVVKKERNFDFSGLSHSFLERRISKRVIATHQIDYQSYLTFLQTNPGELDELIDVLTINYSEFFRNPLMFEYLNAVFIPELIHKKMAEKKPSLRVWSAGCSSGEEAYSLAILLDSFVKKEKIKMDVNIFATDIDHKVLSKAQQGIFHKKQVANVKLAHLDHYFKCENNKYHINENLKKMIHFSFHDLLNTNNSVPESSIFGNFDLVLCRNVLIYFNQAQQELVQHNIYNALQKDGFLVIGNSEAIVDCLKLGFKNQTLYGKIFKKI